MKRDRGWLAGERDVDWIEELAAPLLPVQEAIEAAATEGGQRVPIVDRDSGRVLAALAAGRRRIVEVGTAYGYSTLWLALGQGADGTIVTIDPDRSRTDRARGWWREAGIDDGRITVVTTQAALEPASIGKAILLRRDAEQCLVLFRMVLAEYRKVIRYNGAHRSQDFAIGIDGQITNWAVRAYRGHDVSLRGDEGLFYIDTNTPMMRTQGRDCLPIDFYLQALPRTVRPLLRPLARRVLDRYFDPRTILLDFLANTSIHGRPDLLHRFLAEGNRFLNEGLIVPAPRPIAAGEVERYIANDVMTWRLTRSLRKVEELLQRRQAPMTTFRQIHYIWTHPIF